MISKCYVDYLLDEKFTPAEKSAYCSSCHWSLYNLRDRTRPLKWSCITSQLTYFISFCTSPSKHYLRPSISRRGLQPWRWIVDKVFFFMQSAKGSLLAEANKEAIYSYPIWSIEGIHIQGSPSLKCLPTAIWFMRHQSSKGKLWPFKKPKISCSTFILPRLGARSH